MSLKIELTKTVLDKLGLDSNPKKVKKIIPVWWCSTRAKEKGGLRLTKAGFQALDKAEIKHYRVRFADPIYFSNQLIIWLDNFIDCPFYLEDDEIHVFSEKMAVELVLFSGNIYSYSYAKAKKQSA